jgi:hypothetical protein
MGSLGVELVLGEGLAASNELGSDDEMCQSLMFYEETTSPSYRNAESLSINKGNEWNRRRKGS